MFFDLTFILVYVFVILPVLTCFLSWMLYRKASIWTLSHRLKKTKGWSSRHDATMIAKMRVHITNKCVLYESRSMTSGLWPTIGLCPLRAVSLSGCVPWFVTNCCLRHWGFVTFLFSLSLSLLFLFDHLLPFLFTYTSVVPRGQQILTTCFHFWSHVATYCHFDHLLPLLITCTFNHLRRTFVPP